MSKKKFGNKLEANIGEHIHIALNLWLNKFLCKKKRKKR